MTLNTVMKNLNDTMMHNKYMNKRVIGYLVRVAGLGLLVGTSFLGYRWYSVSRAQAAQKRLSEIIATYTQEVNGKVDNQSDNQTNGQADASVDVSRWSALADLFGRAAKEYSDTSLAPFFLVYQSEVLLKEGNLQDAYQIMSQALALMPRSHELYSIYELKKVLMSLDLAILNKSSIDLAQKELLDLAKDLTNKQRDMALYYAARLYWSQGDGERAKELLQELISLSYTDKSFISPWVNKAEVLIKQIPG